MSKSKINWVKDADRCGECPGNPENREYLQQRGVSVSGVDGRPKSNPVLEAIDDAVQPENGGITTEQHNEMLEDIRAAYLQHHPQDPEVAGRTTNYYACRNCGEPIDMTGTGLEGLSTAGNGEEFERSIKKFATNTVASTYMTSEIWRFLCPELRAAHNADRAEDKRRIAELEAQAMKLREDLVDALQDVISYAPECTSSKDYAEKRIAEIELEPAPTTPPKTSGDMSSLVGDGDA